jgi:hypothetical protein
MITICKMNDITITVCKMKDKEISSFILQIVIISLLLLFVRWTTRSCWNLVQYIWFYDYIVYHPPMLYILWSEDDQKWRPKHVVNLNKTTKPSCAVTYLIPTSFCINTKGMAHLTVANSQHKGPYVLPMKGLSPLSLRTIIDGKPVT